MSALSNRSRAFSLRALIATSLLGVSALAWEDQAVFRANVHEHTFERVEVTGSGCSIVATLRFVAPEHAYRSDDAVRNHYRFRARVRLASGKELVSPLFSSSGPAKRRYTFTLDTSKHGCWAKLPQAPVNVDVEGCRGQGCRVEAFQP